MNPEILPLTLSLRTVSRRAGQRITGKAAYNSGRSIRDMRTGTNFNFTGKSVLVTGVAQDEAICGPIMPFEYFWNEVELREVRWDSRLGRECVVALPFGFPVPVRGSLLDAFAQFLSRLLYTRVDWGLHPPDADGDPRNDHGHLLFPTRKLEDGKLTEKHRQLDNPRTSGKTVKEIRIFAAGLLTRALQKTGFNVLVADRDLSSGGAIRSFHQGPALTAVIRKASRDVVSVEKEIEVWTFKWLDHIDNELESADSELQKRARGRLIKLMRTSDWHPDSPGLFEPKFEHWLCETTSSLVDLLGDTKFAGRAMSSLKQIAALRQRELWAQDQLKVRKEPPRKEF